MSIIGWIVCGLLAGFIAGKLFRGKGFGLLGNLIVGVVGGVLGGWVFEMLDLAATGFVGSLVTAVVGALLLLWVVSRLRK